MFAEIGPPTEEPPLHPGGGLEKGAHTPPPTPSRGAIFPQPMTRRMQKQKLAKTVAWELHCAHNRGHALF